MPVPALPGSGPRSGGSSTPTTWMIPETRMPSRPAPTVRKAHGDPRNGDLKTSLTGARPPSTEPPSRATGHSPSPEQYITFSIRCSTPVPPPFFGTAGTHKVVQHPRRPARRPDLQQRGRNRPQPLRCGHTGPARSTGDQACPRARHQGSSHRAFRNRQRQARVNATEMGRTSEGEVTGRTVTG